MTVKKLPKAQKGCKTCPKCEFTGCWKNSPICEKCFYDFVTGKMPKTRSKSNPITDDDLDLPPVVQEAPKQTTKECPGCKFVNFWTAPACEKCDWDFVKGCAKVKEDEKKVRKDRESGAWNGGWPTWNSVQLAFVGIGRQVIVGGGSKMARVMAQFDGGTKVRVGDTVEYWSPKAEVWLTDDA